MITLTESLSSQLQSRIPFIVTQQIQRYRFAVNLQPLTTLFVGHHISRESYDPLDVVNLRVGRQLEHDYIATLRLTYLQYLGIYNRETKSIRELVHKNEISLQ